MLEFRLNWASCVCWMGRLLTSVVVEQASIENVHYRIEGSSAGSRRTDVSLVHPMDMAWTGRHVVLHICVHISFLSGAL